MIWKEVTSEPGLRLGWMGKVMFALLCVTCLTPGLLIVGDYLYESWLHPSSANLPAVYWRTPLHQFRLAMNVYVRVVSTLLSCVLLLGIAIRAASSIGAERDKQTLDSLLAAPLSDTEIVFAKWLGSIASVRWMFGLLCVIWFIGAVTGGLHVAAVPALILELVIYGGFMASLGMFFAATTKTSLWAVLETVVATLLIGGGHWICTFWIALAISTDAGSRWPAEFLAGLTPPFVLTMTAIRSDEFHNPYGPSNRYLYEVLNFCLLGLALFAGGAAGLWRLALARFRRTSGRVIERLRPPPLFGPVDSVQRMHK
jgi:ABC-type transport system involved in multi-copper enzyme maturation permease subunit